jgi:hypothetical protein
MKAYCRKGANEFMEALLRLHIPALKPMMEMGVPLNDIFEAAKEAGRQPVLHGDMSIETLNIISRGLIPTDKYIRITARKI